ncbi:MAG: GNAT family N-acetyltransferase [Deltaproteobacteria bacterium]
MYQIKEMTLPTESDLQQIAALYREAGWWWEEEEHLDFAARLIRGSFGFYVAELDGEIVGIGRAISDGVSDAYLQDVTVARNQRRKGIGSALVQAILAGLSRHGIEWIGVIAESGSHPFYEKLGLTAMINATPMLYLPRRQK